MAGRTAFSGYGAIVVPVLAFGRQAVLKVAFPHEEAAVEGHALRLWKGRGAVEMLADDIGDCAMLLERLDPLHSLGNEPFDTATAVWGAIVRELSIVPDARPEWASLPSIADRLERWSDDLPATWEELGRPFGRRLLEAGLEVCQTRGAVGRRGGTDVLVHTDLHYENILARPRADGGFLAIDPQPAVGEAEFAVAPMLWNRLEGLEPSNPEAALRIRLDALCAAAGLDAGAATAYAIAREVDNALWYAAKPHHERELARSVWVAGALAAR
ncbi:aminoglycoside resistance protein [Paenarthrobacter sp. DKR-5]|uniref:aminoglycoside phosphotransferase family protein n=1 Tax=Paenarthrobacter sp. DKR-5 TaxID=2835535 RepID=UPI001BDBFB81|nr:aminoglycoside phosphotransferase family protein [Paenarthrobacter sp. DKR-5]MBT1002685.1 aminoglycoside resistance protein [Paenarthrobacter sp. DKR-5]